MARCNDCIVDDCIRFACKELEVLLKGHDKQIISDTTNEFLKELYPCKYKYNDNCLLCKRITHCRILDAERIAKQLRGENNGK